MRKPTPYPWTDALAWCVRPAATASAAGSCPAAPAPSRSPPPASAFDFPPRRRSIPILHARNNPADPFRRSFCPARPQGRSGKRLPNGSSNRFSSICGPTLAGALPSRSSAAPSIIPVPGGTQAAQDRQLAFRVVECVNRATCWPHTADCNSAREPSASAAPSCAAVAGARPPPGRCLVQLRQVRQSC